MTDRSDLDPPQRFVIGGWKRSCPVTCCNCGDTTAFVVHSDQQRDDAWCEAALAETMDVNGWRYGGADDGNDYCERCRYRRHQPEDPEW